MHHDVSSTVSLLAFLHLKLRRTVATPLHGLATLLIAERDYLYLFAHHERRIEAEAEVADDGISVVLKLLQKVGSTAERDLVDILVNLLGRHSDTAVAYGEGLLLWVEAYAHRQITQFAAILATFLQGFQLLRSIHCIGNNLAQENLMIAVKKLLDNRKDVFRSYANITFLHDVVFL